MNDEQIVLGRWQFTAFAPLISQQSPENPSLHKHSPSIDVPPFKHLKHPYFVRKAQAYHISEKMSRIVILGENFVTGITEPFLKKLTTSLL